MNDIETVRHAIAQHTIIYRDDALAAFERIVAAQAQAVKDENEACAIVADDFDQSPGDDTPMGPIMLAQVQIAQRIAAAIRARHDAQGCADRF